MSEIIDRLNAALADRYRIERQIGEGGMATVFLAEDLKHSRRVALKVLKPELAAVVGAERFLSEIQTTANLQHPHILPLHDSGEADTFLYYVMPFIEGETLRDRLQRERQLPVPEAVGLAVSLCGALDHAHRKGVIHRDIKPANILLQDGQPVVADFGIALAVGSAGGARLTETGLSVGTPYYMSPEQATGDQHIGPASDIYAIACVLYEMLVGEPPFPGSTAQAVLGRILAGDAPPATQHRPAIPANVDAAIQKGLEKIAADRFASAEEFAKALGNAQFRHGSVVPSEVPSGGPWKSVAIAATFAATLFAGTAGFLMVRGSDGDVPVARYAIALLDGHDPTRTPANSLAIAPDGSSIVYAGPAGAGVPSRLWVRPRAVLEPTPINGTDYAAQVEFSPDGTRIAVNGDNAIKVASLAGEPPITIADSAVGGTGVAWGDDGYVYFPGTGALGIRRVPESGGESELVVEIDPEAGETFFQAPSLLPGSRTLLTTVGYSPPSDRNAYRIVAVDLETGSKTVLAAGVFARYSPTGHLIYVSSDGQLLARAYDEGSGELVGTPAVVAEGVAVGPFGDVDLSMGEDGTLVYMAGALSSAVGRAVWVDRDGEVEPLDMEGFDPGMPEAALVLSPTGDRVAIKVTTEAGEDVWVKELPDGPLSRLTFDDGVDRRPRWSADGSRIYYTSDRAGTDVSHYDLWAQPSDGTGSPELLLDLEASVLEARMTPDESAFVLRLGGLSGSVGDRDLVGLRVSDGEPFPVANEPWDEKGVALSPSGRWVAYESTETGRDEIYVRPFPDADGGKWQVSVSGGFNPQWAHSEDELFFVSAGGEMVVAQVRTDGGVFRVGERRTLFSLGDRSLHAQPNYASWDVARDDQRLLMLQIGGGEGEVSELIVVQNFFGILEERLGR